MQVAKEHRWLRRLAPSLPLPIPMPLALGEPGEGYPWKWSIYRWLGGDTAAPDRIADLRDFAWSVAKFLDALQRIDASNGPVPGKHNFHRGGPLATWDRARGWALWKAAIVAAGSTSTNHIEASQSWRTLEQVLSPEQQRSVSPLR